MLQRLKSLRHIRSSSASCQPGEDDTDPSLLKRKVEIKEDREFSADYVIIEHLGSGKFGEVKRCRELATELEFASKMIMVQCDQDRADVLNEIKIMQMLKHPRLIQLYDAYSLVDRIFLVLELIEGGELFERIIDENFDLNESKCGNFMREIIQGVEYIHSQKVLHLDLKPENILCLSRTGYRIKIIDFGLARIYDRKDLRVLFGTPEFVAPEIIAYDPVSPSSDMWSVGVICYVLLSGLSPFMDNTEAETLNNIMQVTYSFNYPEFNEISQEAKDFIKKLLLKDPKKRLSASDCLSQTWIKNTAKLKRLGTVSKKRLKRYFYRRKWQKAVNAIIALQRMGYMFHRVNSRKSMNHDSSTSSSSIAHFRLLNRPGTEPTSPRRISSEESSVTSQHPVSQQPTTLDISARNTLKGVRSISVVSRSPMKRLDLPPLHIQNNNNNNNNSPVSPVSPIQKKSPSLMEKLTSSASNVSIASLYNSTANSMSKAPKTSSSPNNGKPASPVSPVAQPIAPPPSTAQLRIGSITIRGLTGKSKTLKPSPVPKSNRAPIAGKIGFFTNLASSTSGPPPGPTVRKSSAVSATKNTT